MLRRASADEGRKVVKIGDNGHGRRCHFLCGVCRVVWRCEDVGLGATRNQSPVKVVGCVCMGSRGVGVECTCET